ncbi:MAG: hypoxanthine phosphoribosyltransferase [Deltaproteobacteria bacterium]|jgi:hypoxanthine phosphoribosyltransferase|nr:hypoxanthine phosphoribosyltransferase [Deltaproteobacteria bacterium]
MEKRVYISKADIQKRTQELGVQITRDYEGQKIIMIILLKGSFIFGADLIREIKRDVNVEFMQVSSYVGQESSGEVRILKDLDANIHDQHVLIVEDIIDTGLTLNKIIELLKSRNPKSIETCSLLSKPSRRIMDVEAKYVGFEIKDKFVIGYGLDVDQKYRGLPEVMEMVGD